MDFQFLSWFPLYSFVLLLRSLVFIQVLQCSSHPDEWYQSCGATFSCGTITGVGYPFRGNGDPEYCGYPNFLLKCNQENTTSIRLMNVTYRVLKIDQATQIMKIAREDVMDATCPQELVNTTFNYAVYDYTSAYMNITFLYGCPVSVKLQSPGFFSCGSKEYDSVDVVSGAQGPGNCNYSVVVPVLKTGTEGSVSLTHLDQLLQEGFEVKWKMDGKACSDCTRTGGRCGYSFSSNQTTCFCPGQPYLSDSCSATKRASPGPGMQLPLFQIESMPSAIRLLCLSFLISWRSEVVNLTPDVLSCIYTYHIVIHYPLRLHCYHHSVFEQQNNKKILVIKKNCLLVCFRCF